MSKRWEAFPLGELCKTGSGGTPRSSNKLFYEGGRIPWLVSGEVSHGEITHCERFITPLGLKNSAAKMFPPNTVVIAMYGATAGQVGILRTEACTNQAVCGILPSRHFDPKFLFYTFLAKKDDLIAQAVGNAQPNICQIKIRNTMVAKPPIPEQKRIVAILDEAFEGINAAIANTEKNLANARELFDIYRDSVLVERGKGWTERKLGEIALFKNGLNFTKGSRGDVVKIVGVKDFKKNFYVPIDCLETAQIDDTLRPDYELRSGDILTVRSNGNKQLIGRCILARDVPERTSHSGFTIRIRLASEGVLPAYLVHFLKSKPSRETLIESGDGASISSLNQQALSTLTIHLPPIAVQRTLSERLFTMAAKRESLTGIYSDKLRKLADLKKAILQSAFSGHLNAQSKRLMHEAAK